jgi:hypothetical protein
MIVIKNEKSPQGIALAEAPIVLQLLLLLA